MYYYTIISNINIIILYNIYNFSIKHILIKLYRNYLSQ